ncbi:MAG: DNA polymerase I [Bacilli bacterium]|nr:DNA polymerase I [Bacilli bacterium]
MARTYIVDGNSLLFRAYYSTAYTGNLMMTKDGIPTNAIYAFHNLIRKIKEGLKEGDHMFVSFDTGKPSFRKQEFEEYKAQRSKAPDELVCQMPMARELLSAMNIHWNEIEGYEGDDLAGSMAKLAASNGDEVTLFTSDKDFLQLLSLSSQVHVCFLKKGLSETIDYTKDNLHSLFGLNPDQVTDFKGIAGDPSDNYLGIKGVGEKTAMKLLNDYGHLEDVLAYCRENPKPKVNQKILEGEKDALFFKKLATIETDLDMKEDYQKSLYAPYQKGKLSKYYIKYQLAQFLRNIDSLRDIQDGGEIESDAFQEDMQVQEMMESKFVERKNITITSFEQIQEKILALALETSSDNENTATLHRFAFASKENVYLINKENLQGDEAFSSWLEEEKKDLAVYDIKGIQVLLSRNQFPKLKGVSFDLLLATYLINPDSGQKKADLFLSYGVSLDLNKNIASQIVSYTADLRKRVEEDLFKNEQMPLLKEVELPLANILADMELEGFPIDKDVLEEIGEEYEGILSSLEKQIFTLANQEFNINSPKQLETVLFTDLGISRPKGEKGTGIEVLQYHINDHPIIPLIIQYRLYNKLVSGYTTALPEHISDDGKIHALYNQALTATGRLSMSEPNLQNISIRNEEGKNIRKAFFYPNKEFYILSLDYSQIELRMLASVAHIQALEEIFAEGKDIHASTAARVFSVPFEEVTPDMRRKAKAVNFGIVYGISAFGLSNQLSISPKEAGDLIKQFKEAFVGIEDFQNKCVQEARDNGFVKTILNRRRYLRDIHSSNRVLRAFSERAATNTVIQGSAADLIKVAMIECDKALKGYQSKIVLQIHDELLFKVPKNEIDEVLPKLKYAMEHALKLSVPLEVDGTYATTWYEAH